MATSDDCGDTLGDGDESKMATSYEISFLHSECEQLQFKVQVTEEHFRSVETRLSSYDARFDSLDKRFDHLTQLFLDQQTEKAQGKRIASPRLRSCLLLLDQLAMATSDDCGDTLGDGDESKMATSYEISFLHSECERLQIKVQVTEEHFRSVETRRKGRGSLFRDRLLRRCLLLLD
ncbi:hypothetical protein F2Q69_00043699 [Brassica cretica]|uniref:Uncharacterized protein n=1 Tax=Brassica cretica TaxID=69181 RepID=A0A8S9NH04_BRACR|nr:hypothetical protein F2Q69_00043699 [Brassica cretica]